MNTTSSRLFERLLKLTRLKPSFSLVKIFHTNVRARLNYYLGYLEFFRKFLEYPVANDFLYFNSIKKNSDLFEPQENILYINVNKSLSDYQIGLDDNSKHFEKSLYDNSINFDYTFYDFNQISLDNALVSEINFIDIQKIITDQSNFSDYSNLFYNKNLFDESSFIDYNTFNSSKILNDFNITSESFFFSFAKPNEEYIENFDISNKILNKSTIYDSNYCYEEINYINSLLKKYESLNAVESVFKKTTNKLLTETTESSEKTRKNIKSIKYDFPITFESQRKNTNKILQEPSSDYVEVGYVLELYFIKNLDDYKRVLFRKILSDSKSASEQYNKRVTKISKDVSTTSEKFSDVFTKKFNDNEILNITEAINNTIFNKDLSESINIEETFDINLIAG